MNLKYKSKGKNKLIENVIFSGTYQLLIMMVPIVTTPYVTRIFNVSQMGSYGASLSIASIFVILSNFGLPIFGSREIAKTKSIEERTFLFWSLWKMQIVTTCIFYVIFLFIIFFLNIDNKMIYTIQSLLIVVSAFDISWFYIGIEEIKKNIFRNLITKIFTTMSILFLINTNEQLNQYALINILGILLGNLTMFMTIKRYLVPQKKLQKINILYYKQSGNLLVPQVLRSVYSSWDRNILLILSNSYNVGIYDQGIKIINLIFSIINASMTAIMPRMSNHISYGKNEMLNIYFKKLSKFFNVFTIIIISGVFCVSDFFVDFFFGQGYGSVALVLKISSISFFIMPTSVYLANGVLIPLKKDKQYLYSIITMAITIILFNLVLDSKLFFVGASISFVLSEFVGYIVRIYYSKSYINLILLLKNTLVNIFVIVFSVKINLEVQSFFLTNKSIFNFIFYGVLSILINFILIFFVFGIKKIIKHYTVKTIL